MLRVLLLAAMLALLTGTAQARYEVQLVSVGPGELYWERFGHNALLISDPVSGQSISYNYGLFDFQQANFLLNFVRGRMLYRMGAFDGAEDIRYYLSSGRRVVVQDLDLNPDQVADLLALLEWNRRPDNAEYRYDYFLANCSTRIRDAIDHALGGQLQAQWTTVPAGVSFRDEVNRLTRPQPWLYLGTQLALGQPVDREISAWERFFLPMALSERLDQMRLTDGRPLVRSRQVLAEGRIGEPTEAPSWWPLTLLAGLVLAVGIVRWRPLALVWWSISGVLGAVLLGIWLFTDHWAAAANENVLVFSPLGLAVVFGRLGSARWAGPMAAAAVGCVAIALVGKASPWLIQPNLEFIALALPAGVAGWFRMRNTRRVTSGSQPKALGPEVDQ